MGGNSAANFGLVRSKQIVRRGNPGQFRGHRTVDFVCTGWEQDELIAQNFEIDNIGAKHSLTVCNLIADIRNAPFRNAAYENLQIGMRDGDIKDGESVKFSNAILDTDVANLAATVSG